VHENEGKRLWSVLSLAMVLTANSKSSDTSSSSGTSAGSSNYPGDLTKGRHLTIYVEGLADPSSGFFPRAETTAPSRLARDLGVDVKLRFTRPASTSASYTEKIEEDHRGQA